jgi:hypothetical protein
VVWFSPPKTLSKPAPDAYITQYQLLKAIFGSFSSALPWNALFSSPIIHHTTSFFLMACHVRLFILRATCVRMCVHYTLMMLWVIYFFIYKSFVYRRLPGRPWRISLRPNEPDDGLRATLAVQGDHQTEENTKGVERLSPGLLCIPCHGGGVAFIANNMRAERDVWQSLCHLLEFYDFLWFVWPSSGWIILFNVGS